MTLRTKENQFAHLLTDQIPIGELRFDLSLETPVIGLLHPKIISARLERINNPQQELTEVSIVNWHFDCFTNISEAKNNYPAVREIAGHPWSVFQFLSSKEEVVLIDFSPLGSVILSRNKLENKNKTILRVEMSIWLSYALSPELWNQTGKWNRFHARLHQAFESKKALVKDDFPGYYPLKPEWKRLENYGFIGSNLADAYILVIPWTFPLSALEKLEILIQQEF